MRHATETNNQIDGRPQPDPIELIQYEIPHLRRYARYLTKNVEQADDMVQDCLVRAIENIEKWEPGTNLRAWLIVILRNNFFNVCRRARKENEVKFDPGLAAATFSPPAQDDALSLVDLTTAYGELSIDHREVIELIVIEGFSYDQVAEILDINVGTVKSRLSRARAELRNRLDGVAEVAEIRPTAASARRRMSARRAERAKPAALQFARRLQSLLDTPARERFDHAA
jgi:RNA polymerase sigma-70 factor (ECF subfamily)